MVLQAYAYALTKAEDEGDVRAFHSLIGSVLDELGLHATYAAKWGLDIHNVSSENEINNMKKLKNAHEDAKIASIISTSL